MKNPIVQKIVALLAGFVVFFIVSKLCESASIVAYPTPKGVNPSDTNAMQAFVKTLPFQAFLMVIAGYAIAAFTAGFTAIFISKSNLSIAIILGFGLLLGTILNVLEFPQPIWVSIASCIAVFVFAWLGGRYALHHYVLPNQNKQ